MKKKAFNRWVLLTAALALLFSLMPSFAADDGVYVTVVNDEIKKLEDKTMPIYYNDQFYVPYTIFYDEALGVNYSNNTTLRTLTFYNRVNTLKFNRLENNARDNDQTYNQTVLERNNTLYVPIEFVCEIFHLSFTFSDGQVPMLRIVSKSDLDSIQFRQKYGPKITAEYNAYKNKTQSALPPSPTPSSGKTPPPQTEEPDVREAYLTFDCRSGEGLTQILDELDRSGIKAAFFLSDEVISAESDAIRRMIGTGHMIGLLRTDTAEAAQGDYTTASAVEQIKQINQTLDLYTSTKTRLLRFSHDSLNDAASADVRKALSDAGYVYWDWTLDTTKYASAPVSLFASNIRAVLEVRRSVSVLRFAVTADTSKTLPRLLDWLEEYDVLIRNVTRSEVFKTND